MWSRPVSQTESAEPQKLPPLESPRGKRVRCLLAAVMVLGFLGGPCAVQDVFPRTDALPSKTAYMSRIESLKITEGDQMTAEQKEAMADASLQFLRDQNDVRHRFRKPLAVAGTLMALFYLALFCVASWAWRFGGVWIERLSKVALAALPLKVARSAVEYAVFTNMKPAVDKVAMALAHNGGVSTQVEASPAVVEELGRALGKSAMAVGNVWFWGTSLAVVALLYASHRVFGQKDVQDMFLRPDSPDAKGDGGDSDG